MKSQAEITDVLIKNTQPRGGTKWRVIKHPTESDMDVVMWGGKWIQGHYSGHCNDLVNHHNRAIDIHRLQAKELREHARYLANLVDELRVILNEK